MSDFSELGGGGDTTIAPLPPSHTPMATFQPEAINTLKNESETY